MCCQTCTAETWRFVGSLKRYLFFMKNTVDVESVQDSICVQNCMSEGDWLSFNCKKKIESEKSKSTIKLQQLTTDPVKQTMQIVLNRTLERLKTDGYVLRKHILKEFRHAAQSVPNRRDDSDIQFDRYMTF